MFFLPLDLADGVLEHRGDVEADVDRLAIGLAPEQEIVARLPSDDSASAWRTSAPPP
jgi:hypothetical protein